MKNKYYIKNTSKIPPTSGKVKNNTIIRNILFWVIIACFCLFTLGSTLGTIAFFKTAKADSVEETAIYEGNSMFLPTQCFTGSAPNFGTSTGRPLLLSFDYMLSLRPYVVNNNFIRNDFNFKLKAYTTSAYQSLSGKDGTQSLVNISKNDDWIDYTFSLAEISSRGLIYLYYENVQGYIGYYGYVEIRGDKEFNCNVISVQLYSIDYTDIADKPGYWYVSNIIKLTDNNGKILTIDIPCCISTTYASKNSIMLDDRIYYNSNNFSNDSNFLNGKNQGYQDGKKDGEKIGYNQGYEVGKDDGYQLGKVDGINQSSNYNLYTLISTLFNVPVNTFIHLINFEFFGVNLANFFTGALTIAIILFIVSKVWGR